jgi:hypothetical protein
MSKEDYFTKYGRTEETKNNWKRLTSFKGSIKFVGGRIVAINPKD